MSDSILTRPFQGFVKLSASSPLTTEANACYGSLPLYSGPQVTIRIAPTNCEYKLSKALVCKHSPVFKAAFEGGFREGQEQETTLNEEDGVVSIRSFELLVQWMYLGQVIFGDLSATESITAAIEFARIADMYGVIGMEAKIAKHVETLIKDSSPHHDYGFDPNTYLIESEHIAWAVHLAQGHPVRKILATASVKGYFRKDEHKFTKEAKEISGFSFDLLEAVKDALKTMKRLDYGVYIIDPISKQQIWLDSTRE